MFRGPRRCKVERIFDDAVHAAPREHTLLNGNLVLGVFVLYTADRRVLTFDVLAHDVEIDIPSFLADEWARYTVEQAHGSEVHVLIEFATDRNQQSPERDMIGNRGEADRAEIDGIMCTQLLDAVLRHHAARLEIAFARPVELLPNEVEAVLPTRGLQHAHALGHDLGADSVARDQGDVKRCTHGCF